MGLVIFTDLVFSQIRAGHNDDDKDNNLEYTLHRLEDIPMASPIIPRSLN